MRIAEPARKHGIPDEDIWHAVRNALQSIPNDDDDFYMVIGPAWDGTPLEIGILDYGDDDPAIIHAMPLRPKFYRFLRGR